MTDFDFIEKYFTEETIESIFFIISGVVSIFLALFFWLIIKYSFHKGMAYPLIAIGIIQLTVGVSVLSKSSSQLQIVEVMAKETPANIKKEEIPRLEQVLKDFKIYKIIEVVCMIVGLSLYVYFFKSKFPFWKGIGLGLIVQSFIMLALDFIAEDRAAKYLDELAKFVS